MQAVARPVVAGWIFSDKQCHEIGPLNNWAEIHRPLGAALLGAAIL